MGTFAFEKSHDFSRSDIDTSLYNSKLKKRNSWRKTNSRDETISDQKALGFKNGTSGNCKQTE